MTSLLVIGGSGFFGKSILDSFKRGLLVPWGINRIEVVARKASNLATSNPELMSKNVLLHDLDITSCTYLPVADYVIHAAASSDARNYLSRPERERANIQLGTSNFCKLAENFFKKSKILYISSGAVYGGQPADMDYIDESFVLQDFINLDSGKRDYASAKRDAESYILDLGIKGFNVGIARCFAFLGPYLPRDQHFAIGNFIEDGLEGRAIRVNAQNVVYRSYLHADDLVTWLMTLANGAHSTCPVVNVGSDEFIEIRELAKIVAIFFSVEAQVREITYSIVDRYVPSINKAIGMGCRLPTTLENALLSTITAIKKNNEIKYDQRP